MTALWVLVLAERFPRLRHLGDGISFEAVTPANRACREIAAAVRRRRAACLRARHDDWHGRNS